ncbi:MAG: fibronectin type III domain-containing protein [Nitrospirae bacterium]|nr:MAG: fibronectin type III domain-containing protein [Nitrospirota bacterium]
MWRARIGQRSSSGTGSVWSLLQVLHSNFFKYPRHHLFIWINRLFATSNCGTRFASASIVLSFLPSITHEVDRNEIHSTVPASMEQHMTGLTKQQFFLRTRVTGTARTPLLLSAIVTGLLLMMIPFLTGCGGDEGGGAPAPAATTGITASLEWSPVPDRSVYAYFVHYGQRSPGHHGSCNYEASMWVDSPSATITDLDPNIRYYFAVSAYNGREGACSNEVSVVTPPASV